MSFVSSVCYVRRSRVIAECGFVPSPCHAGRSVHVGLRRFPFPIGLSAFLSLSIGWSANRWYVGGRSAYMGVPPLFSFFRRVGERDGFGGVYWVIRRYYDVGGYRENVMRYGALYGV